MKNLMFTCLAVLVAVSAFAQRRVEESYSVSSSDAIKLEFKFANDIKLMQWDKNEVKITADVTIDDGEGNDSYSLKQEKMGGDYIIKADYGDYFDKKKNWGNNCSTTTEINYVVYIPKNADLSVKSISGNLFAESYSGNLTTDLVAGDVEIKKYNGKLNLKTVAGDLDVAMSKAKIDAKTVTGTIYTDLDIQNSEKKQGSFDSHVKGIVNNGQELVKLETVAGNIYMRKG